MKPSTKTVSALPTIVPVDEILSTACKNPSLHVTLKSVESAALRQEPFTQSRGKFSFCTKNARPSRLASQAGKLAALGTLKVSKREIGWFGSMSPLPVAGFPSEPQPAIHNDAPKAAKPIAVKPNFFIPYLLY
jgi:hypothetical protein